MIRIGLFLMTNIAVMLVIAVVTKILGSGKSAMLALFSTHPPLEKRIEALRQI